MAHTKGVYGDTSALRNHRHLVRAAFAAVGLFAWIFIFQFFHASTGSISSSFVAVARFYALAAGVTLLFTPWSASRLRHGVVSAMIPGILCAAAGYTVLGIGLTGTVVGLTPVIIGLFALLLGAYRALYWVPYISETPRVGTVSVREGPVMAMGLALIPIFSGLLLTMGILGLSILISAAVIALLLSLVPLLRLRETQERFSWTYSQTFRRFFSREYRMFVIKSILDGITGAALHLFWPLAIFLIVGWSYPMLGVVVAVTYLCALVLRHRVHAFMRRMHIDDSSAAHAVIAASSWAFRLVVSTPLGIVLVDSYSRVSGPGISGADPLVHEHYADGGSYIDEYTALKEMAVALGKILMCAFAAISAMYMSPPAMFVGVFLIAACVSVVSVYLLRQAD